MCLAPSVGSGLEWAATRAAALIHDNDVEKLQRLIAEHAGLLTWHGEPGGVLGYAVEAYGDSFDPDREKTFTRRACAELLLDAGAEIFPSVFEGLIVSRTRGMLHLLASRGSLPRTPRFLAALGDTAGLRAWLDSQQGGLDAGAVNDAFICACRFENESTALVLLDRCISLDAELGRRIDGGQGRESFVRYLSEERALEFTRSNPSGPWQAFLMHRVMRAVHDDDLATFTETLRHESWLLGEQCVGFQVGLLERATLRDRGAFIGKLLEFEPAVLRVRPAPSSQAILDNALGWAVLNGHYEIADFLLERGADINTRWASHEPASILHELVFRENYEAMQFLIDRGIDMTIRDHRWNSTAEGWARYGAGNEKMAEWLAAAQRSRDQRQ